MKLNVFVYIPSKSVREVVYDILAKKGWRWYHTSDPYGFDPGLPFYLYMPKKNNQHLSWCSEPYFDGGGYTQIEINEFISEWEEDNGTDQERCSPHSETARI